MEAMVECCAGVDVHQGKVVVCLLSGALKGQKVRREVRTFRTMRRELEQMAEWLQKAGCTHVGMESTGVYWMPVYAVLEGGFKLLVGNAQHIKKVPGRKTDVTDAEWIARLVRSGMMPDSYVPPAPLRALREVLRYRRGLVEARTQERNRLLKLLETANVKLASVATDVFGVSGMLMLRALAEGKKTPEQMAHLARGLLRKKVADLVLALEGRLQEHQRQLLSLQLERLDDTEQQIGKLEALVDQMLQEHQELMQRLCTIPGVDRVVAATLIAELGVDMKYFPTERHAAAWAGVAPGNNESAGKQGPVRTRRGNVHLKTALVEAARSASRAKGTYLRDKYHRLKARRGANRAAMAIAHKILKAAYHLVKTPGVTYKELGESYLDECDKRRVTTNLVRRLQRLGYRVALEQQQEERPAA